MDERWEWPCYGKQINVILLLIARAFYAQHYTSLVSSAVLPEALSFTFSFAEEFSEVHEALQSNQKATHAISAKY